MFKSDRPTKALTSMPSNAWSSALSAIFTAGSSCSAVASKVTTLENLEGIPNAVNNLKKQVFTQELTGKGGPISGNDATFYNYFGVAVQQYLKDNQGTLQNGVMNDVGDIRSYGLRSKRRVARL